jgi:superfamily II DNA/RNA helicase
VPYHAQVPLEERAGNLDKFRRYKAPANNDSDKNDKDTVPVLVCTDLASRGLDIPGVTAVVQLQFATNVVIHLHRMGRCGRAGNSDGRGIIFYGAQERELVEVVREAEEQQSSMTLSQDVEEGLDDDDEDGEPSDKGKVKKAFSRKRGFTKKRKKERREAREAEIGYD